jgi:hypothetical protein
MADSGNSTPLFDIAGIRYVQLVVSGKDTIIIISNFHLNAFFLLRNQSESWKLNSKQLIFLPNCKTMKNAKYMVFNHGWMGISLLNFGQK